MHQKIGYHQTSMGEHFDTPKNQDRILREMGSVFLVINSDGILFDRTIFRNKEYGWIK